MKPVQLIQMAKSLAVVLGVALICSFVVTSAAVLLEERQQRNLRLERIRNILRVAGLETTDPFATYRQRIEPRLIDLHRARAVDPAGLPPYLQPDTFDFDRAARDPRYGEPIPTDRLGLKRRPRIMPVYLVKGGRGFDRVVLLIVGKGLWSTLYGYIALERDLVTVAGIVFYQQGETPGLGGEIANPRWQALWHGKRAYDDRGEVAIRLVKGQAASPYEVDALSGATLTTRGVERMIRYWLGPEGYGPYLTRLRLQGGTR